MTKLDMQVAGTQKGVEGVRQATDLIERAWDNGQSAINAVESGLGRGKLGKAFMSVYRPEANRVADQTEALVTGGRELVTAAHRSVEEYQATDERLRAEFEKLLSPNQLLVWSR